MEDTEEKIQDQQWYDIIERAIEESKQADLFAIPTSYFQEDSDNDCAKLEVVKEGYLRKKRPGNNKMQDMKR